MHYVLRVLVYIFLIDWDQFWKRIKCNAAGTTLVAC